ncbi:MAG: beta-galactosidase [Planctomycetota bacterium]|nr:beta-galactosidase [Planctomycetota bacterium]
MNAPKLQHGLCPIILSAFGLFAEGPNLLPNGDFEEGGKFPTHWTPYVYAELGKTVLWSEDAHSGKRCISVQNPPVGRQSNGWQHFVKGGMEPGATYKVTAWVRSQPEQTEYRHHAHLKVIQRDAAGEWITRKKAGGKVECPSKVYLLKATDGWEKIEFDFFTEAKVSQFQFLVVAPPGYRGKVWLDDLRLFTDEDTRPSGRWINEVDAGVTTPHIKWASPLPGRKLKLFVLLTNQGKRDLVELFQRLDCEFTSIVTPSPSILGFPASAAKWSGTSEAEKLKELHAKLEGEYDVYVVGNVAWNLLPIETRYEIFKKASAGAGLVFVFEQKEVTDELRMLREHPVPSAREEILGSVPGELLKLGHIEHSYFHLSKKKMADVILPCRIRNGRAVFLDYPFGSVYRYEGSLTSLYHGPGLTPYVSYGPETIHHYEHYLQLLIRSVLWAGKRLGPCRLDVKTEGTALEAGKIQIQIVDAPEGTKMRLWHRLMTRKGIVLRTRTDEVSGNHISIDIRLPADQAEAERPTADDYVIDLRLLDEKNKVRAFASRPFAVGGPALIREVQFDRKATNQGILSGELVLSKSAKITAELSLTDIHSRVILREQIEGEGDRHPFLYALPQTLVARLHTLRAILLDPKGNPLAANSTLVPVPIPDTRDVQHWLWSTAHGGEVGYYMMNRYCKERWGIDLYEAGQIQGTSQSLIQKKPVRDILYKPTTLSLMVDQLTTPYSTAVLYRGKALERKPCLHEFGYRNQHRRMLELSVKFYYENGVKAPFYTLGDEFILAFPGGPDVCFAEHTQKRFRRWLQRRYYNDLRVLNGTWRTAFKTWDEVSPITLEDAKEQKQLARWLDHRLHMDDSISELVAWSRKLTLDIDPEGKVGFEGMFRSYSECGYDMERLTEICDLLISYEYPYRWEMLGSFRRPGVYYGVFSNSLGGAAERTKYQVWKALFHGLNSIWWWRISGKSGFLGFDLSPGAHPKKYEAFDAQAAAVNEARKGIARLLHTAKRTNQPIAILHSQSSLHATKAYSDAGAQSGTWAAFQYIFEDMGVGYRYVKSRDVADGLVTPSNAKVLVLPYAICLPDDVIRGIRDFAAKGGTLLADIRPAMLDAAGNYKGKGALDDVFGIERIGDGPLQAAEVGGLGPLNTDPFVKAKKESAAAWSDATPVGVHQHWRKGQAILMNFTAADYGAQFTANDFSLAQYKADFNIRHEIRKLLQKQLQDVVQPITRITPSSLGLEQFEWRSGQTRLVCLVRKFFGGAYLNEPLEREVNFNEEAFVYDVRKKKYLGATSSVKVNLEPGHAALFALMPYKPSIRKLEQGVTTSKSGPVVRIAGTLSVKEHKDIHHVLRVEVIGPAGKRLDWYSRNLTVKTPDFSTTLHMSLNEQKGKWTAVVTDVASGHSSKVKFQL